MKNLNIIGIGTDNSIIEYCDQRGVQYVQADIDQFNKITAMGESTFATYHLSSDIYSAINLVNNSLEQKLFAGPDIVLMGSGRYHHLSHAVLKEGHLFSSEFSIINIDNHSDFNNKIKIISDKVGADVINCGSHVSESLSKTNASECFHVFHYIRERGVELVSYKKGINQSFNLTDYEWKCKGCEPLGFENYHKG